MDANNVNMFESLILPFILEREGSYVDDPSDSGGATNCGITQDTYDRWNDGHGQSHRDVRYIQENEVRQIYYELYYLPCYCDRIPYPLNLAITDFNVTSGANAIKVLQRLLKTDIDGIMGAKTYAALSALTRTPEDTLIFTGEYLDGRELFYRQIGTGKNEKFVHGWLNRCELLRKKCFA